MMPLGQAIDLAEKYVTRLEKDVQPFKDLRDVLRATEQAAIDLAELQRQKAVLDATITARTDEAEALTLHVEQARQRWAVEEKNATDEMARIREELAHARNEAQSEMARARAEAAKVKAQAEDATSVRLADLNAQVVAAEARLAGVKAAHEEFMARVRG